LDKLHILFISSWYPVKENPTHGIFNRYFAEAAARRCTVSAVSVTSDAVMKENTRIEQKNDGGILTVAAYYRKVRTRVPFVSQFIKYMRSRHALMAAYSAVTAANGKPQLIQLNVVMPMGPLALFLSRREKIPYVISENWSGYTREDGNYRGLLQKRVTERVVREASRIMPTSEYLKSAMRGHGLRGEYTVVPNVVNTDVFNIREQPPATLTRLVHVSSLNDREKNVSGLIRAFGKSAETLPALELLIVGRGVDEGRYRKLVADLRLNDRVQFAGRLTREELAAAIATRDALLMFSNYETFCLVIPEAFACGKPAITSAAGAIPSYMRPELGIMVPVGDEAALSKAIIGFAADKEKFDPVTIRRYAIDHFSYEKVGDMLYRIYTETLKNGK
jgi:L-malate glycosyltransferase